nr:response regulator [uncultured Selenomonas sp.]
MIKVLIIDDEPLQRQGIMRLTPWEDFDAEVVGAAGSGMEGILLARKYRPDVLIVDIKMPGLSGLDVITRLREELDAEYIILSGYSEFEYAQQAISLGVCAYLLKPLDDEELTSAVRLAAEHIAERRFHLRERGGTETDGVHLDLPEEEPVRGYLLHAVRHMEEHMAEPLTVREVADELGLSVSYLHKLFARCGTSFSAYLTDCRLRRAGQLLRESDEKIYAVAAACGYQDTRYFSKIFQKHMGVKPTEYRHRKNL